MCVLQHMAIPGIESCEAQQSAHSVIMNIFVLIPQGSCAADLYRHPQLDADIEAVKDIYMDSAISVRYCKSVTYSGSYYLN